MELYLDIIFATCTGGRDPALKRYKRYFNNDVIITVRNSSCGKVMFLHLSVIMFTAGVCSGTPLGQTSPWEYTPPGQTPPPPRRLLQRTVRILLECILVRNRFSAAIFDVDYVTKFAQKRVVEFVATFDTKLFVDRLLTLIALL